MKAIYTTLFIFMTLACCSLSCLGQNVSVNNIQWNSERIFNATSGQWSDISTSITTYGSSRVEWKNSNGSIRNRFQVVELIGEWSNVNVDGFVQYEITDGAHSGTVTIRKEGSEVKILISIGTTDPTLEELTITSKQAL